MVGLAVGAAEARAVAECEAAIDADGTGEDDAGVAEEVDATLPQPAAKIATRPIPITAEAK
jgi:hypothetical protein